MATLGGTLDTIRDPKPDENPQIAYAADLKHFDPDRCWWFDADKTALMAAEHEDIGDPRYSIYRTAGGRYVEVEHADDPDNVWYLSFQVARSLSAPQAARRLFEEYPHVSNDTDEAAMSAPLVVAFQLGQMMATFGTSLVKVPNAEADLRDADYRIAHARQQFADAGDLAQFVRDDLLPALRAKRVEALRDLLRELQPRAERASTFEELLLDAAEVLGVSLRTVTEMFKRG